MSTPYKDAARAYFDAGWSPIPLPFEEKSPPPSIFDKREVMFTGVGGVDVTEKHLKVWLSERGRAQAGKLSYAPGNIGLRLPKNVLGIDVDAYGTKKGAETFAAAELEWGALPPTWVSTSKDDGVSGIRLFRIPPGLKWPGELPQGKGVELIRWDHRYAVVSPSIHDKTKLEYQWNREVEQADGSVVMTPTPDEFPDADDETIPDLPKEWVEGLTGLQEFTDDEVNEGMDAGELNRWLAARNAPDAPCSHMRKMQTRWVVSVQKAADDGGAHDEMRDAIWGALNDAKAGHSGIVKILAHLRNVFLEAVKNRRPDEGSARSEWARAVLRGGKKVTGDANEPEEEDPCDAISSDTGLGGKPRVAGGSGPGPKRSSTGGDSEADVTFDILGGSPIVNSGNMVWELTQFGNADRVRRVMNGRARWVPGIDVWMIWDGSRWIQDSTGQVNRWATKAINQIEEEATFAGGGDEKEKEANVKLFKSWMKASSKVSERNGAIQQVRDRKGITVPLASFDAQIDRLNLPNGTLILGRDPGEWLGHYKVHRPGDLLTLRTEAKYVEGAESEVWTSFLERALPDEETRLWVQKMAGYSLLGENSARLFPVVFGASSTGKSTFAEAIRKTLGDYAASVNLSMFRDNQDERPRPDLVRALPKRIIFAEEASSSWHLHPDQVKRLTGKTQISARLPHKGEYLEKVPAFTPWLLTNSAPTIEGADDAFWRRLRVIPFNEVIDVAEEVAEYADGLDTPEARSAILSWLVRGYVMWKENPDTQQPPATWFDRARFEAQVSDFDRFVSEVCVIDPELMTSTRDLYETYREWGMDHNIDVESETAFGKFLGGRGFDRKSKKIDGQARYVRVGIGKKANWRTSVS